MIDKVENVSLWMFAVFCSNVSKFESCTTIEKTFLILNTLEIILMKIVVTRSILKKKKNL